MNGRAITAEAADHADVEQLEAGAIEVYWWRLEQLQSAGYSDLHAHELAASNEVDLHVACDLLGRGCPEFTAFAIVS
jgi:hypothetical protein